MPLHIQSDAYTLDLSTLDPTRFAVSHVQSYVWGA